MSVPGQHQRAPLWLARDALAQNDPALARDLVEPLAAHGNRDAMIILGAALAAEDNFDAAIRVWSQVDDPDALLYLANEAKDDGRTDEALAALRAMYEVDAEKGTFPLASLLWFSDLDANEPVDLIRKALAEYPYSDQRNLWLRRLGQILQSRTLYAEAEAVWQQTLAEYPQDIQAYISLGWVYYWQGDGVELAQSTFQKAIEMDPSQGDGYLAIAQVLALEMRMAEADPWFAQAVALNPDEQSWWLAWGNALRANGDLTRAFDIYGQLTVQSPDWAPVYYEIAWAYRTADSKDQAVESIRKALALSPSPPVPYYLRAGLIYEWAGYSADAIAAYQEALFLDPKNEAAQMGLQRLGQ